MSKIKIVALGGLNESGKNMYVIHIDNDIFVMDAGLRYAEDVQLGIDYVIPDFSYLKANIKKIKGIFLTNGHENNMGAITDIIKELPKIPVYGTKFTLNMVRLECLEQRIKNPNLNELTAFKKVSFGKSSIFPVSMTYSVPDTVGYVINTPDGAVVYTGNYAFDFNANYPFKSDIGKLAYIGKQGVLCLLGESLYADRIGHTSPYHRIGESVYELLVKNSGRLIFNINAVQVFRIQEIVNEVLKTNRKIVFMGKKLQTIIHDAIKDKYLKIDKKRIGDLSNIDDPNVVLIVANDFERPFANINRIVSGYDKYIKLLETDTIVFTEPTDDSAEKIAANLGNEIARMGANVVPFREIRALHASKEDILLMFNLMNPKYYIPVAGDYRFQVMNADIIADTGFNPKNILLKQNGDTVKFLDGKLINKPEKIKTGEIFIDGTTTDDIGGMVLKDREMLSENGIILVSATIDKKTKEIVSGPDIATRGFIYVRDNIDIIKEAISISKDIIESNISNNYVDYNKIKVGVREALGKYFYEQTEGRPMVLTVITEANLDQKN